MKKLLSIILLVSLAVTLCACGDSSSTELSFSAAMSVEKIQALNGKPVSIVGYMSTLSPIDGTFIYLMNMPYQSCPFCIPNTTQLANTMAVYAPAGKNFDYTDRTIRVTGTLETGNFTDIFGYQYNYRIANASYAIIDLKDISEKHKIWNTLAEDGVPLELYNAFTYLNVMSTWPELEYTASYNDGSTETFFLYPGDVEHFRTGDGIEDFSAYCNDSYYDNLIARVKSISATDLNELTDVIRQMKTFSHRVWEVVANEEYFYVPSEDRYYFNDPDALWNEYAVLYNTYDSWLAKWSA